MVNLSFLFLFNRFYINNTSYNCSHLRYSSPSLKVEQIIYCKLYAKEGEEYLVFISRQLERTNEVLPVYELYDDSQIAPVFCYESQPNVIVTPEGETSYVSYQKVRNNEFFAETEEVLSTWNKLKSEMLAAYPINKDSRQ